ncbi:MAG: hypothetical protein LH606_21835 [Cytophagaceae bacterium]|nr:hypothetical protein [Cytophagaceae bacterium]
MNSQDRKHLQKLKSQLKEAISFLDRLEKEAAVAARKKVGVKRADNPVSDPALMRR